VAADEPLGTNTQTLGGVTFVGSDYPETAARLQARGAVTRLVDISELAKANPDLLQPHRRQPLRR
jgi:hypothetical protein